MRLESTVSRRQKLSDIKQKTLSYTGQPSDFIDRRYRTLCTDCTATPGWDATRTIEPRMSYALGYEDAERLKATRVYVHENPHLAAPTVIYSRVAVTNVAADGQLPSGQTVYRFITARDHPPSAVALAFQSTGRGDTDRAGTTTESVIRINCLAGMIPFRKCHTDIFIPCQELMWTPRIE